MYIKSSICFEPNPQIIVVKSSISNCNSTINSCENFFLLINSSIFANNPFKQVNAISESVSLNILSKILFSMDKIEFINIFFIFSHSFLKFSSISLLFLQLFVIFFFIFKLFFLYSSLFLLVLFI